MGLRPISFRNLHFSITRTNDWWRQSYRFETKEKRFILFFVKKNKQNKKSKTLLRRNTYKDEDTQHVVGRQKSLWQSQFLPIESNLFLFVFWQLRSILTYFVTKWNYPWLRLPESPPQTTRTRSSTQQTRSQFLWLSSIYHGYYSTQSSDSSSTDSPSRLASISTPPSSLTSSSPFPSPSVTTSLSAAASPGTQTSPSRASSSLETTAFRWPSPRLTLISLSSPAMDPVQSPSYTLCCPSYRFPMTQQPLSLRRSPCSRTKDSPSASHHTTPFGTETAQPCSSKPGLTSANSTSRKESSLYRRI